MGLKHTLEKQKELKEMQSAVHTNSDAYEDRTVEDNEAELQEQEEATVGEKSNWGLLQSVESSRDVHRFTGYDKDLRKSEDPVISMESNPLSLTCCFTAVIPLLLVRS
jgi:hypothetical protein